MSAEVLLGFFFHFGYGLKTKRIFSIETYTPSAIANKVGPING